jgi:hypothetical protein
MKYYLQIAAVLLFFSCQAQELVKSIRHNTQKTTLLLDSAAASRAILIDRYNHFFDLVTPCEMSIQMKKPLSSGDAQSREDFKRFLQKDMESFTAKESQWVAEVMKKVFETCNNVNPGIFPDSLILIKTKGNHYGDGVYYTRGNCIIIPADIFEHRDRSEFTATMYHEVFHVYSRLHPEQQKALYQLIGFEHIGLKNLEIPAPLRDQILFNPDGVDFGQKIALKISDTETIQAVPIIYANNNGYTKEKSSFFSYLEFNLFKITPLSNDKWKVETQPDGLSSTLQIPQIPDFYRQIKDNTTYIIHPDEVLADNFSFIMLDKDGKQISSKFSKEGKQLLKDIEVILKK